MEDYTPRPERMYPGELTDRDIRAVFEGAGDFMARQLRCGEFALSAYAIDGITSGGDISEYVVKPITEHLFSDSMEGLYDAALRGGIYNAVASECKDLDDAALKLVEVLQEQGYLFVTVEELLRLNGVVPEAGVLYRTGLGA